MLGFSRFRVVLLGSKLRGFGVFFGVICFSDVEDLKHVWFLGFKAFKSFKVSRASDPGLGSGIQGLVRVWRIGIGV